MKTFRFFMLSSVFILFVKTELISQTNTNYGTGAGNSGYNNSSYGYFAGSSVTSHDNVFVGLYAGRFTTSGSLNAIFGAYSGTANTTGGSNTFLGYGSGNSNTTGSNNTYVGRSAGFGNVSGSNNVFVGYFAGRFSTGSQNAALGYEALRNMTSGIRNSAIGTGALINTTTGHYNTAFGYQALSLNTSGTYNTSVGYSAGTNSGGFTNSTSIGAFATNTASNQVRIGNSSVTSIGGFVGWSIISDGRFKDDIQENVPGLEFINKLRPVNYTIKDQELSKFVGEDQTLSVSSNSTNKGKRKTGLIAQEVEQIVEKHNYSFFGVNSPDNENDHYTINYSEFVLPLIKSIQELSNKVEEQQLIIKSLIAENQVTNVSTNETSYNSGILHQNYPNPFNRETIIQMDIPPKVKSAKLVIFDLNGTLIKDLDINNRGNASISITSENLSSGVYIYSLILDERVVGTSRMIISK